MVRSLLYCTKSIIINGVGDFDKNYTILSRYKL